MEAPVVHRAGRVHPLDDLVREMLGHERPDLVATRVGRVLRQEAERRDAPVLEPGVAGRKRPRLGPPEEQLDVVLEHEAVAAVHVQRCGRGLLGGLSREHVGHRREQRLGSARRFVREQAPAVDRGGRVGQPVLHGLERADGHAELPALLHIGDADVERALGQAHQRGGGEHAPFVERPLEPLVGFFAAREHRALTRTEVAVGDGGRPEVRGRGAGWRRPHDDQLLTVERDDRVGDGTRGHQPASGPEGDRGEGAIVDAEEAGGDQALDDWHGREMTARGLGHHRQVDQPRREAH